MTQWLDGRHLTIISIVQILSNVNFFGIQMFVTYKIGRVGKALPDLDSIRETVIVAFPPKFDN